MTQINVRHKLTQGDFFSCLLPALSHTFEYNNVRLQLWEGT